MSLSEDIEARQIKEVVHFTTNRGLVGILASKGIKATRALPEDQYLKSILHKNAIARPEEAEDFDQSEDWLDYVNLSISAVNESYLGFSQNWPHNRDLWWYILSFNPEIMTHPGVYFATTNNGYPFCHREAGESGFEKLFAPVIRRKIGWNAVRRRRPEHLPTCQQAEVLYPKFLSTDYLQTIYVQHEEDSDRARGWLRFFEITGVEVSLSPDAFKGFPN